MINQMTIHSVKSAAIYQFKANLLGGTEVSLGDYQGKVLLIVNTASRCGFTPQYQGLENLYQRYKEQGLVVLGFPCNQFGAQEPGNEEDIGSFCQLNYGVSFPMFAKIEVNGKQTHPLFCYLRTHVKGFLGSSCIKWNFTKFLINRDGQVIARYGSLVKPEKLTTAIERLL
jgi:glutathione peroxidase